MIQTHFNPDNSYGQTTLMLTSGAILGMATGDQLADLTTALANAAAQTPALNVTSTAMDGAALAMAQANPAIFIIGEDGTVSLVPPPPPPPPGPPPPPPVATNPYQGLIDALSQIPSSDPGHNVAQITVNVLSQV